MMKRFMLGMFIGFVLVMIGFMTFTTVHTIKAIEEIKAEQQEVQKPLAQVKVMPVKKEIPVEPYKYVITEIDGDEINGLAITRKTSDNSGIVLSKEYNGVNPKVGDIVEVTYGKAFDDIKNVKIVE